MKLFFHYCPSGFSNCYILGSDYPSEDTIFPPNISLLGEASHADSSIPAELSFPSGSSFPAEASPNMEPSLPREAIIIDPGNMDSEVLNFIEKNSYELKAVLITHDHPHHVQGLKTINRIYGAEIYAINPIIDEHRTTLLRDGDIVNIGSFNTEVISIPGHSADSAVYKIGRLLFTGDTLGAGLVGKTASTYAAVTQASALRNKILSLPGEYTILPGHGPPTSLEAERRFNLGLNSFEYQKSRRPTFKIEF